MRPIKCQKRPIIFSKETQYRADACHACHACLACLVQARWRVARAGIGASAVHALSRYDVEAY